jgi:quercetin dioxygenase-like cupin family protein
MALFIVPSCVYVGAMNDRREFLQASVAALTLIAGRFLEAKGSSNIETKYSRDLPPVNLDGWQVTVVELTFPPGVASPKHTHPGFVLGYVLEGEFRFHIEGERETVLAAGEIFYEPPGSIHLASGSANPLKGARVLAFGFAEKGKELLKLL